MLHQGVGWIRPTRLAPEGSPFFAVPGGSLGELSDLMTEVPLNGRLAGLGCQGSRECAPCAAKNLDMNRRESLDGMRGAQMAMQGQPIGWGLGRWGFGAIGENGETLGTDEQARPQDILFTTNPEARRDAYSRLEWGRGQVAALKAKVQAIGPPGYMATSWFAIGLSAYEEQYTPIFDHMAEIGNEVRSFRDWLTEDEVLSFNRAMIDLNNFIFAMRKAKDAGVWQQLMASVNQVDFAFADVGNASVAVANDVAKWGAEKVRQAGAAISSVADTAASIGKWGTFAAVAVAVILGFVYLGPFIPKGRR